MRATRWWSRRRRVDEARSAVIHAPAAAVWDLVSDADRFHRTAPADHLWTFVVPGTPAGQVGERRVTVWRSPDRGVSTTLIERTAMIPGRRLVTRSLKVAVTTTTTVEPRSDGTCELTYRIQSLAPATGRDAHLVEVTGGLDARLARVGAAATGHAPPAEPGSHAPIDRSGWTASRVTVRGTVSAPPSRVWPAVRITGGDLRVSEPGEFVATVPGTPRGKVGELLCWVSSEPAAVHVMEVVADEVDRVFALRYVDSHTPATRTVTLAPHPVGTDVTIDIEFRTPPATNPDKLAASFRRAAEVFLRCYQQSGS